jgi:hypothetical protein
VVPTPVRATLRLHISVSYKVWYIINRSGIGEKNSYFPRRNAIKLGINVKSFMTVSAQIRVQPLDGSILVNPRLALVLVPVLALALLLLGIAGT